MCISFSCACVCVCVDCPRSAPCARGPRLRQLSGYARKSVTTPPPRKQQQQVLISAPPDVFINSPDAQNVVQLPVRERERNGGTTLEHTVLAQWDNSATTVGQWNNNCATHCARSWPVASASVYSNNNNNCLWPTELCASPSATASAFASRVPSFFSGASRTAWFFGSSASFAQCGCR